MSERRARPGLFKRLAYFRERGARYTWILLARKFGKRVAAWRIGGRRYRIPTDDAAAELMRDDEPWMAPLLRRVLPECEGSFLDAGANIGQTLLRLKAVDPARNWIGFEPNPACCDVVRRVAQLNDLEPLKLIEKGLADFDGEVDLHLTLDTDTRATILAGSRNDWPFGPPHTVRVPVVDGRALADSELAGPVGFVKIDVEGAELEVLRGLLPVLRRDRPPVLFELLPVACGDADMEAERARRQGELLAIFAELGYRVLRVGPGGALVEFDDIPPDVPRSMTNYLARLLTPA